MRQMKSRVTAQVVAVKRHSQNVTIGSKHAAMSMAMTTIRIAAFTSVGKALITHDSSPASSAAFATESQNFAMSASIVLMVK